jgi:hypothetical protein
MKTKHPKRLAGQISYKKKKIFFHIHRNLKEKKDYKYINLIEITGSQTNNENKKSCLNYNFFQSLHVRY